MTCPVTEAFVAASQKHGEAFASLVFPHLTTTWKASLLQALRSFLEELVPDGLHDQLLIDARRSLPAVSSADFVPTLVLFFEICEGWRASYTGSSALNWSGLLEALVFKFCEDIVSAAVKEWLGPDPKRRRCASGDVPLGHVPACRDVIQPLCNRLLHKKTTKSEPDRFARIKDIFAQKDALEAELVAKLDSHEPFAWKIMSMMLDFTRVQSLLCIKKQKVWQAQKRSERAHEEASRKLQATSGFGEWHCLVNDWDRRTVRATNSMDKLMAQSRDSAHFRPCIGEFLRDLTDTHLGATLDDHQLFHNYRICLEHYAMRLPPEFMQSIVVKVSGCATYDVAVVEKYHGKDIVKDLLNEKGEGDLFLLLQVCCNSCTDGLLRDREPVLLPHIDGELPVRQNNPARFVRTAVGDILRSSENQWRRLCKGVNHLRDRFLAAERLQCERRERENDFLRRTHGRSSVSLQNDAFLQTLTSDEVDCPKCQLPMEKETMMVGRSDEGHSVILRCHSCQLFLSKGVVHYQ